MNLGTAHKHSSSNEIDADVSKTDGVGRFILVQQCSTAEGGANSSRNFSRRERFCHVIVGAGIESVDFVPLLSASGNHKYRHPAPFSDVVDDLDSIFVRQTQIQEYEIGTSRGRLCEAIRGSYGLGEPVIFDGQHRP